MPQVSLFSTSSEIMSIKTTNVLKHRKIQKILVLKLKMIIASTLFFVKYMDCVSMTKLLKLQTLSCLLLSYSEDWNRHISPVQAYKRLPCHISCFELRRRRSIGLRLSTYFSSNIRDLYFGFWVNNVVWYLLSRDARWLSSRICVTYFKILVMKTHA